MPDRETLINSMTLCLGEGTENPNPNPCDYCAYSAKGACVRSMMHDALQMLKSQESQESQE